MIPQVKSASTKLVLKENFIKVSFLLLEVRRRAKEPLGLVHSDVCRKIQTPSLGGGHYSLTVIDDNT